MLQESEKNLLLNPSSIQEAMQIQSIMSKRIVCKDQFGTIQTIGGVDVSNNLFDPMQMIYASIVTLSYSKLQLIEQSSVAQKQTFAYIPGLLGFREIPALFAAFSKLERKPDILLVDGHGISHPRRFGIASHLGMLLDIPTIGVAKSILIGKPAKPLKSEAGASTSLIWKESPIAMLLRTKAKTNPLIISIGYKVSLPTAIEIVKTCLTKYKLPEPTRQAHLAANVFRKAHRLTPIESR